MNNQIISKENLSQNLIKEIFEAAFFEVTEKENGGLVIKEQYSNNIEIDESGRFIAFYCNILCNKNANLQNLYDYINSVNRGLIAIRVAQFEDVFSFDYYLWVEGGVTNKNIIMCFRNFTTLIDSALSKAETDVFA